MPKVHAVLHTRRALGCSVGVQSYAAVAHALPTAHTRLPASCAHCALLVGARIVCVCVVMCRGLLVLDRHGRHERTVCPAVSCCVLLHVPVCGCVAVWLRPAV